MDAFNDELNSFKNRIRARAQARIDAAMKEYEEVSVSYVCGCGEGVYGDPANVFCSFWTVFTGLTMKWKQVETFGQK